MNDIAFSEFEAEAKAAEEPREQDSDIALPEAADVTSPRSLISPRETLDFQVKVDGTNKLLELSASLLGLCVRLRNMGHFEDVDALHARLSNEIANFQQECAALGYDDATTLAARYCLCSMVDESVLSQPWGADSSWPERPMLSIFHNETWGGEKVFGILDRVMDDSQRFMDLLELIYFCLALGFEGKYHVVHNGRARLDALLENVYGILEKHSGEAPTRLLSPDALIYDQKQKMGWRMPAWLVLVCFAALLVVIHLYFDRSLNVAIDNIGERIGSILGSSEQVR